MTFYAEDFKELECAEERRLTAPYAILRLDGSNFSSFTKQYEKPFSDVFERAMNEAAKYVARLFPTALITYVGSDEISVLLPSMPEIPYGGRVQKLVSLSASYATVGFLNYLDDFTGVPAFDSRIIQFSDKSLIDDYFAWRRLDMRKNAISMAASYVFPHKKLLGVSTRERIDMLQGTPFEKIDEGTFNGRFIIDNKARIATRDFTEEVIAAAMRKQEEYLASKQS